MLGGPKKCRFRQAARWGYGRNGSFASVAGYRQREEGRKAVSGAAGCMTVTFYQPSEKIGQLPQRDLPQPPRTFVGIPIRPTSGLGDVLLASF